MVEAKISGRVFERRRERASHAGMEEGSLALARRAARRSRVGVGVETIGTDAGQVARFDPPFCNHFVMHGHGKFGLASLTNLDLLPLTGAVVIAAPLKIVSGSGSPVRVIALKPAGIGSGNQG